MRGSSFFRSCLSRCWLLPASLLVLLGTVSITASAKEPIKSSVGSRTCPQFVTKYCVYNNATKQISTASTNPCLAKQQGLTAIYLGACNCACGRASGVGSPAGGGPAGAGNAL